MSDNLQSQIVELEEGFRPMISDRDEDFVKTKPANFLTSSLDLNHRVEVKFHLAKKGRSHADRQ